jgi:heptaprenyl diphosphate synthase
MKRLEFYENTFSARILFLTGLIVMPALLFNPSTEFRVVQFLFFLFLVWLSGRKNNVFFTFIFFVIIVVFNLIVPYGKVLFSFLGFKITEGALKAGVHRASTFGALIMISKVTVRQDLKIPGTFGGLLGESLRIFSIMMSKKNRITVKNFFTDIDNLLLELSASDAPAPASQGLHTKPAGYIILAVVIILSWLPWVFIFGVQ